jgi:NADH-quinone oxidoreductase subunit F
MTEVDLNIVDELVAGLGRSPEATIPILQAIQGRFGWLPPEALARVCGLTDITPARIEGVSTFYMQFRHRPVGRHCIHVCDGTACHVKGAESIGDALRRHLKLPAGEDTDSDGTFTVEKVACLGCCTLAPVIQIDQVTYGHLTADAIPRVLHDFLELQKAEARRGKPAVAAKLRGAEGEIRLGMGSCCVARGSGKVKQALEEALTATGVRARIKRVGCVGMCYQTPLVEVVLPGQPPALYARVSPTDAKAIVLRHFRPVGAIRRAGSGLSRVLDNILTDEVWPSVARYSVNVRDPAVATFLDPQRAIATEHRGDLDPTDLEEYERGGGFAALRQCIESLKPAEIIDRVTRSGLRGRGGAGYPTGRKWQQVRAAVGEAKYVVCNGDEGDPGAFMDRMIMESYPYRVLEGMMIAALAVGATEGKLYIRAEYPLAVQRIAEAIRRCEEKGLLGRKILGSNFDLSLSVMQGAGAFVCGEETALLASIEGRRGMPRFRPPYPAQSGLWGKPTLVNNVETFATVPWIIRSGAEALAALGTQRSKGTKVFALAGKIARGGLIEVPMGLSLRQVVMEIGGGIAGGKRFKAVQVGGPSGGCVPAELADLPIDYEALTGAGAIMGSGGLVVLDEGDCMVEIARYFLQFTQDQSCGRCTFCRVGTRRMLDILDRLCAGEGRKDDLQKLEELAGLVRAGSLCGLGKTAPNPVVTTLRYYRDEYEAHLQKRCPAGRCKALVHYAITDDCIGCTLCSQHCPADAIGFRPYEKHEIDQAKCIRCDTCRQICPALAVKVE